MIPDTGGQPPPIAERDRDMLVEQTTQLVQQYSEWRPPPKGQSDPGQALIGVFARFAELVVARINRALDRNYLAFLNLIGAQPLPPRPARVPLTFSLAERSPADAVVPAGTQVAAVPLEGENDEIVFETDTPLVVTRAQLRAVVVHDAENDSYSDRTPRATGDESAPFEVFVGGQQAPHQLFIACDPVLTTPGTKDVTLVLSTTAGAVLESWQISWAYWDGAEWQPASSSETVSEDAWRVRLTGLPQLPPYDVNGVRAGWVRAQLEDMPLPPGKSGLAPESVAVGGRAPQDEVAGLFPFGETSQVKWFYLSADETIATGGATVRFHVELSPSGVVGNRDRPVQLVWSYKAGAGWTELGRSSSQADRIDKSDPTFRDGTRALTDKGDISFQVPKQWPRELFRGRMGRWLRVEIADDGGEYATLPRLSSLTASYVWDLPSVTKIEVQLEPAQVPARSPAAFCNSSPLDVSKDFYPFGEHPRFNDTCYLACPDDLAGSGTRLGLTVRLTNASDTGPVKKVHTTGTPKIVWEAWDGTGWSPAIVNNKDYAFTSDATVQLTLPSGFTPTQVNGVEHYWLRVRLVGGHYGAAASYTEKTNTAKEIIGYELVPATLAPPVIAALSWSRVQTQGAAVPATACVSVNGFHYKTWFPTAGKAMAEFQPFAPGVDRDPALYLGFDQPFDPQPVALYLQVEPPAPDEVTEDRIAGIDPSTRAQLVWEYSGRDGWQPLAALDGTDALAGRGLVQFVGPADLRARDCFGQRWHWLRLRWHRGTFPVPPRLRQVLPNTTWATQAATVSDEILGSGNGDPDQSFTTAQTPVLPGQHLVVRESGLPPTAEATALAAVEGSDAITVTVDERGRPDEIWVRWHPVPDFSRSGPLDRHYTVDPLSGQIQFGNGHAGRAAPRGQNNVRITYRTGGGAAGNRAAKSIVTLQSAAPYVDAVTNHEPAQGGSPPEPIERLRVRGPRLLRHRDRAVTAEDLEDLAFEATADVARVQVVLPSRFKPSPRWLDPAAPKPHDGHGDTGAGSVGVLVVPDSSATCPTPSLGLLRQVQDHLRARCPATMQLWVAGPEWIEVTATATVVPRSPELAEPVRGRVKAALERYLHPLTGGPDGRGWAFGRKPHRSDLFAVAEAVEGVDHLRSLHVEHQAQTEPTVLAERVEEVLGLSLAQSVGPPPAEELLRWLDRSLVYSGTHDITVILRG